MSTESPYAAPKSALVDERPGEINRKGRYVVYEKSVGWPSRCFKCNATTNHKNKTKLTYLNPWIYLSLLVTPLLTILLSLIFSKKFTLDLPICEVHRKKRRNFLIFQWLMVAIMVAGFVIGGITDMKIFLLISIAMLLIVVLASIFGRLVHAAKYKNGKLWVSGAGNNFLDSLSDFVA